MSLDTADVVPVRGSQHTVFCFFEVACRGDGIKARETHRLSKPLRKAISVVRLELDSL